MALVRKLDEIRVTERGGDPASELGRRAVVEVASQDQRRNAAPHRRRHRCIAQVWKPLFAFRVKDAPERRSRDRVDRIERPPVHGAGGRVIGTVDERAQRTVGGPLAAFSHDFARCPRAGAGAQLVEQQRETGDAHADAIEHPITDVVDESPAIQPDSVSPTIRAHDRHRDGGCRQVVVDRIEILLDGRKRVPARRLACARGVHVLQSTLCRERLLRLDAGVTRHRTCQHDGADRPSIACHGFLGEARAIRHPIHVPRRVAERATKIDQIGHTRRRVVGPAIDTLRLQLGDAGTPGLRHRRVGDGIVGGAQLRLRQPRAALIVEHDVAMEAKRAACDAF